MSKTYDRKNTGGAATLTHHENSKYSVTVMIGKIEKSYLRVV